MELHSWPNNLQAVPLRPSREHLQTVPTVLSPNPFLLRDEAVPTQTVFLSNAKMLDGVLKPSSEVGLGSNSEVEPRPSQVRLSLSNGHAATARACRFRAKS
jgi:hypothetical protein